MFGFGKTSKTTLANRIISLATEASEEFLDYLKEDSDLYSKCINMNPIKHTGTIFMINLYRDMLSSKYDDKDIYVLMRFIIFSAPVDKPTQDLMWQSLLEYMKLCNDSIAYYQQYPSFDLSDVLTKVYFSLIIDDREYLEEELEWTIPDSVSYRKIYNYINGVIKRQTLLNEEYRMKLKKH